LSLPNTQTALQFEVMHLQVLLHTAAILASPAVAILAGETHRRIGW
jgi:hypothetical protein